MAAPPNQRKPTFFWQGVLILLPVVLLAVVSLLSLHQDERAAEADARNRATANAQSLARVVRSFTDVELFRFFKLQNEWMTGLRESNTAFPDAKLKAEVENWEQDYPGLKLADLATSQGEIRTDGRQIKPPDFPPVPIPPRWFQELSPPQRREWEVLRSAADLAELKRRQKSFLASNPSKDASQAAFYLTDPLQPIYGYDHIHLPATEAGISYQDIACYRLLSATNAQLTDSVLNSIWHQVVEYPSFVTPKLLQMAEGLTNQSGASARQKINWMRLFWNSQSRAAEALGPIRRLPELPKWKSVWWSAWTQNNKMLAVLRPSTFVNTETDAEGVPLSGQGYDVWFMPRAVVEGVFKRALEENKFLIPEYAAAIMTIEGVSLADPHGVIRDENSLLGSAVQKTGNQFAQDAIHFDLKFYLTSREQMLSGERRRSRLLAALILGTVCTALAGLLANHRAFRRQLQLSEMKSNFVSSVSHELRAPIASVRLMAENLEHGKVSEPANQNAYFRFIVQECQRLSSLIENILDFSRIEEGRKQYEFEPTDLVALTGQTVQLMAARATERGAHLEAALPEKIVSVEADGKALQQALVNLIDNAIKHSPKGAAVKVGLDVEADALRLWVEDQGEGIPSGEQERIFERFYRRGSELRRETQGVGIGLSIVKHIVEAHGGRIQVRSDIGHGSRFTIELPVKTVEGLS